MFNRKHVSDNKFGEKVFLGKFYPFPRIAVFNRHKKLAELYSKEFD
jgi:hypothetical protein